MNRSVWLNLASNLIFLEKIRNLVWILLGFFCGLKAFGACIPLAETFVKSRMNHITTLLVLAKSVPLDSKMNCGNAKNNATLKFEGISRGGYVA